MKKHILKTALLLATIFTTASYGQDFYGEATYVSKTTAPEIEFTDEQKSSLPEGIAEMIDAQTKGLLEKTYTLQFNKTASLYTEVEKPKDLEVGNLNVQISIVSEGMAKEVLYKDIKNKTTVKESDIYEKLFLVTDSLSPIAWQLQSETKKIGDYTCHKATYTIDIDKATVVGTLPEGVELPSSAEITAWYTTEIPVSNGPGTYWGLPGLILEVNDGHTALLCSKIVLNPKEKPAIKAPKKGKAVTGKEFNAILAKKQAEALKRMEAEGLKEGVNIQFVNGQ